MGNLSRWYLLRHTTWNIAITDHHQYLLLWAAFLHGHAHIYTRTYNMYIWPYTSTPGTSALPRLRVKPYLTPRKIHTSPLEAVVPPPFNKICSTRNDGQAQKQTQLTAAHHTFMTARRPDYNRSSAQVRSQSTQFMARPSC